MDVVLLLEMDHGSFSMMGWLLTGMMPVVRNPETRFVLIVGSIRFNVWSRSLGKSSFLRPAAFLPRPPLYSSNTCLQCFFIGPNTATSNGCSKWVEFGGRATYSICSSRHFWITSRLKCEAKLSPMSIFFPGRRRAQGTMILANQSPNELCGVKSWYDEKDFFKIEIFVF